VNPNRFGAHNILKPGISRVTRLIYSTVSDPATLFETGVWEGGTQNSGVAGVQELQNGAAESTGFENSEF
jgi:hypothetical protein